MQQEINSNSVSSDLHLNHLSLFDFEYPEDQVAMVPTVPRDHCRLLVTERFSREVIHSQFFKITQFLRKGDLLVLNDARVLPARLRGKRKKGGDVELLLLHQVRNSPLEWACLSRPGRKIKEVESITFSDGTSASLRKEDSGQFFVQWDGLSASALKEWLQRNGELPLPPYIKRPSRQEDQSHYQTVYARALGSIAAPTAGLHFTNHLLADLREKGVDIEELTLHIGYSTFSPIRVCDISQHPMHSEDYEIPSHLVSKLKEAKVEGRRIIAVGTSVLRAIESLDTIGPSGETSLFIKPGFQFEWVNGLVTNFHLPKSSLFVLVAAFMGLEAARRCYERAISESYRLFSYGDAMLILPNAESDSDLDPHDITS